MAAQLELALGGMLPASASTSLASASKKKEITERDDERMLQLMMGPVERPSSNSSFSILPNIYIQQQQHQRGSSHFMNNMHPATTTLDLFGKGPPPLPPHIHQHRDASASAENDDESGCCLELDSHSPLPPGWEKCLDLMTGSMFYLNRSTGLSTSCDPRRAVMSSVNWPTSPSSSSDLTFEANGPSTTTSASKPISKLATNGERLTNDSNHLDLSLSLGPTSLSLSKSSLNHDQIRRDSNHNLKSLISSHSLLNNHHQSFTSTRALPLNSTSHFKSSITQPTCAFSASSPSSSTSPSKLTFQELNASRDRGSLGPSISSKFEAEQTSKPSSSNQGIYANCSKPISINQCINTNLKPITSNLSINVSSKPPISNNLSSSPMITVGCANCLMFVMLPKSCTPRCPRCGASIDDTDLPQPPSKKAKLGFSLLY